ncbi:hypothetical protein HYDPIDRAFT_106055 [Hydnomerulius pinastri MD-312]|nr:hypothetical protein HYDPIDRAFT_106055 [Hydnomerulius pinastri MD-312]
MVYRALDNLRCYLHEARLPTMAHRGAVSSDLPPSQVLNVRPERYRKLRLVHTLDAALFADFVYDWSEEFIPCESLGVNDEDEDTGERLTVSCEPYFTIHSLPLARADDNERVFMWVDMFPLETIRRVLHLLHPESKSWKFEPYEEGPILKILTWSQFISNSFGKTETLQHLLGLFILPPWTLSAKDLQDFAEGQSFPDRSAPSAQDLDDSTFLGQEWLWSKIWDACVSTNCPWFIVSTYNHWVFGVFSAGWTASFVSPVFTHHAYAPTILELVFFWTISAMGYPGGWVVPEIRTESALHKQLLTATVVDISPQDPTEALALSAF